MTTRAPLVNVAGRIAELPAGDSLAIASLTATRVPYVGASGLIKDSATQRIESGDKEIEEVKQKLIELKKKMDAPE